MNTDVRLNERIVLDSPELAAALFARLEGVLPPKFKDLHLNSFASCVRLYKYGPGNYFKPHTDAGFEDEVRGTTFVYTTLFYLNTVQRGGETSFFGAATTRLASWFLPRRHPHRRWNRGKAIA